MMGEGEQESGLPGSACGSGSQTTIILKNNAPRYAFWITACSDRMPSRIMRAWIWPLRRILAKHVKVFEELAN
jgi:hypothetical protein